MFSVVIGRCSRQHLSVVVCLATPASDLRGAFRLSCWQSGKQMLAVSIGGSGSAAARALTIAACGQPQPRDANLDAAKPQSHIWRGSPRQGPIISPIPPLTQNQLLREDSLCGSCNSHDGALRVRAADADDASRRREPVHGGARRRRRPAELEGGSAVDCVALRCTPRLRPYAAISGDPTPINAALRGAYL